MGRIKLRLYYQEATVRSG